jgi:hypothetical protein
MRGILDVRRWDGLAPLASVPDPRLSSRLIEIDVFDDVRGKFWRVGSEAI